MQLGELIKPQHVVDLKGKTKEEVLRELVRVAGRCSEVQDEESLYEAILERELEYTTGIGLGIAVPHAKIDAVRGKIVILGRSAEPIEFNALDDHPVSIFALIAVGSDMHKEYIRILARIALFLKNEQTRKEILAAKDSAEIYKIVQRH